MTTRRTLLVAAGLAATASAFAQATAFPNRPIRLVVPTTPGGTADIAARLLAEAMRAELGQTVLVDNRPGATGLIGVAAVANAPPDGYTVLMTARSYHVMGHLAVANPPVIPPRDVVPVGLAFRAVGMFACPSSMPYRSVKDLVAYAKSHPGKLFYGSSGVGAFNHVIVEQFKAAAGIEIAHVPYKGTGALAAGLMGGEIQLGALDFASAQSGVQGRNIVPLAQTGSRRHAALAEVPTLIETGFGDQDLAFWMGLALPKGTPPDVVSRLNQAMNAALAQTRVKATAHVNGWEMGGGGPEVLAAMIDKDMAEYPALFRKLDIRPG
jgi:tripartite-type tricarboxylate transporter receptor subunit TctC